MISFVTMPSVCRNKCEITVKHVETFHEILAQTSKKLLGWKDATPKKKHAVVKSGTCSTC